MGEKESREKKSAAFPSKPYIDIYSFKLRPWNLNMDCMWNDSAELMWNLFCYDKVIMFI